MNSIVVKVILNFNNCCTKWLASFFFLEINEEIRTLFRAYIC